ncbi:TonB-dependent siderophore receptor [Lampropedia puyangensis]|uniref:TonB-dependent siderophore receptor n=1 Tax=Lampropedia puyangensis TaxID=1330072 RepID=A0A4S8FCJ4_9BURK|nr:TonB-dependent receptor [Lampropedia puyangensis]THU05087.1 TonB-dependent siderophore receptor [Lampropedia puyangensis]
MRRFSRQLGKTSLPTLPPRWPLAFATSFSPSLKPSTLAVRAAILGLVFGLGVLPVAQAQQGSPEGTRAAQWHFDVGAGGLGDVLAQFAAAAGVQLVFDPASVAGQWSRGLQGRYTVQQAFELLLQGTGWQVQGQGEKAYALRKIASAENANGTALPEVVVTATGWDGLTEGTGSYAAKTVSLGKSNQALREVPRSVSVITRSQLNDQRIASFDDVVEQLPGVTLLATDGWGSGGYYSRGHTISNFLIDGAPARAKTEGDFTFNTSMAKYDSVQFLHGPDGLFSGNGQPSGTMNLIRKKPTAQQQFKTAASIGSWQNYLGEVDFSTPVTQDGRIRTRVVASYNDRHKFYDNAHRKDGVFYGVASVDLTAFSTVNLGFSQDRKRGSGHDSATAFPRYVTGELLDLPRSIGLPAFAFLNSDSRNYFVEWNHHFNDAWSLAVNASTTRSSTDVLIPFYNGAVDPVTGAGSTIFQWTDQYSGDVRSRAMDARLSGHVDAFNRKHRVLLGADYVRTHNTGAISSVRDVGGMPIDWNTFNPGAMTQYSTDAPASFRNNLNLQKGLYGFAELALTDNLKWVLGGRYARYDNTDARGRLNRPVVPTISRNDGYFLPYYALVYDIASDWTVFVSRAESFEDQSRYYSAQHRALDPTKGVSYEVGIKGEHLSGQLQSSLTLYRTKRNNYAVKVSDDPSFDTYGASCCYSGDGRFESRGIEVQVSGELTPAWQVNAGYAYDDNSTQYGEDTGQRYASFTPRHTLRVWSSYRLSQALPGLRLGGGVRMQSEHFREGSVKGWNPQGGPDGLGAFDGPTQSYRFTDPGRAVWNVFAEYPFSKHWTAGINVNNVFDKKYLQSVGTISGANMYGEPRSVYFTLRGSF